MSEGQPYTPLYERLYVQGKIIGVYTTAKFDQLTRWMVAANVLELCYRVEKVLVAQFVWQEYYAFDQEHTQDKMTGPDIQIYHFILLQDNDEGDILIPEANAEPHRPN